MRTTDLSTEIKRTTLEAYFEKATLNPVVLVEVLSDSTELIDKNDQWNCYREIKSLRQYITISQNEPLVECYTRVEDTNRWEFTYTNGLEGSIMVAGFDIAMRDNYDLVNWNKLEATPEG